MLLRIDIVEREREGGEYLYHGRSRTIWEDKNLTDYLSGENNREKMLRFLQLSEDLEEFIHNYRLSSSGTGGNSSKDSSSE